MINREFFEIAKDTSFTEIRKIKWIKNTLRNLLTTRDLPLAFIIIVTDGVDLDSRLKASEPRLGPFVCGFLVVMEQGKSQWCRKGLHSLDIYRCHLR